MLTQNELIDVLLYDPDTGIFTWKVKPSRKLAAGRIAGSPAPWGYIKIGVKGKSYSAHRLAWLYVYGEFPIGQIDHINGVKTDNRISNLRDCDAFHNQMNKLTQANNTSGFKGVTWHKAIKRWTARLANKHLGTFDNPEDAYKARVKAGKEKYGEFFVA